MTENVVTDFDSEFMEIMRRTGVNFKIRHSPSNRFIGNKSSGGTFYTDCFLTSPSDTFYISQGRGCSAYSITQIGDNIRHLTHIEDVPNLKLNTCFAPICPQRHGCATITRNSIKINGRSLILAGNDYVDLTIQDVKQFDLWFVTRGEATKDDLIKISPFFANQGDIPVTETDYYEFCTRFPTFDICYVKCDSSNQNPYCITTNVNKCFQNPRMNPKENLFCQNFTITNRDKFPDRIAHFCTSLDDLDNNRLCREVFKNQPLSNCGQNPTCQTARNLYASLCEKSSDPRCKCINTEQLERARDAAINESLGVSIANAEREIDDAIAQETDPIRRENLIQGKSRVGTFIRSYYQQIRASLQPVNSQCLISECRDKTLPVITNCSLDQFSINICINSIDIRALGNGQVTFRGNQTCVINAGKCNNGQCPGGFRCENGNCITETQGREPLPEQPGDFSWVFYLIIFLLLFFLIMGGIWWFYSRETSVPTTAQISKGFVPIT